jgi:hypothetical protein
MRLEDSHECFLTGAHISSRGAHDHKDRRSRDFNSCLNQNSSWTQSREWEEEGNAPIKNVNENRESNQLPFENRAKAKKIGDGNGTRTRRIGSQCAGL